MSGSSILSDVDSLLKSLEYDSDGASEPSNEPSPGGLWEMGAGSAEPQNPDLMRGMAATCFPERRSLSKPRTVLGPDGPVVVSAPPATDDDLERFPADADHEQKQREQFNYYTAAGRKVKQDQIRQRLERLKQKLEQGNEAEKKELAAVGLKEDDPPFEEVDDTEFDYDLTDDSSDTEEDEDEDGSDADSMATDEVESVGSAGDAPADEDVETESVGSQPEEEETQPEEEEKEVLVESTEAKDEKDPDTAADKATETKDEDKSLTPPEEPDVDTVSPRSWAGSEAEPLPPQPGFNYDAVDSDLELEPFDSTPKAADPSDIKGSATPRAPSASASPPPKSGSLPPAPSSKPAASPNLADSASRKTRVLDPAAVSASASSTGELVQHGRNLVGGGAQVRNAPPLHQSEQKQGDSLRHRNGIGALESPRTAVTELLEELDRPRKKKSKDKHQKKRTCRSIWKVATSPELVTIYFYVILTLGFIWELVTAVRMLVRPALQQAVSNKLEL